MESKAIGWPDNLHRDWLVLLLFLLQAYCCVYDSDLDFHEVRYALAADCVSNSVAKEAIVSSIHQVLMHTNSATEQIVELAMDKLIIRMLSFFYRSESVK